MAIQTKTPHPAANSGFSPDDFNVFLLPGLEQRMSAIQEKIQPKFRVLGQHLTDHLSIHTNSEMFLHIARHARRKVNPPKDTWLAVCSNKRGYKAHPHFQLGLFDDRLFLWLALIYELPNKKNIATSYLNNMDEVIAAVPDDYVISMDHMKKEATVAGGMTIQNWEETLVRFRDVQKAELLIGRHIPSDNKLLGDEEALLQHTYSTFEQLIPLYRMAVAT